MDTTIPSYRTPAAYGWSIALHAGIIAAIALAGLYFAQQQDRAPKVFELVAGEGQNYMGTEAPGIGTENGIKFETPKPAPAPSPAPVEASSPPPQPVPLEQVPPPQPAPVKKPVKLAPANATSAASPINFNEVRRLKQIRVESAAKMRAAREAREREKQRRLAAKNAGLSYEQYLKEQGAGVNTRGRKGGVVHGTSTAEGAGGRALTAEMHNAMEAWMAYMRDRIREGFVPPADFDDRMTAHVKWNVSAGGAISNVRVTHSDGNEAFTQAVLEAFRRAHIPPPPNHRGDEFEVDFSLHDEG